MWKCRDIPFFGLVILIIIHMKNDMMLGFKQYCEISQEAKKRMFCKVEYNII